MPAPLPQTRDTTASAYTYSVLLGWPVARGHRYRPRGGCTCRDDATAEPCPAPGAHPLTRTVLPSPADRITDEFRAAPGAAVIAPTLRFDAVVLPRDIAMAAMVLLDRHAQVPCLASMDRAALIVAPGTAAPALGTGASGAVRVRTGPDQWVALPPSHGVTWDTPPWDELTGAPLFLPDAQDIRDELTTTLRQAGIAVWGRAGR
jgi:hypothetical protein